MARIASFIATALLIVAAASAVDAKLIVAAVQLVPEGGVSPLDSGINAGLQVAEVLNDLATGSSSTSGIVRRGQAGINADAVPDLVVFPEYGLLGNFSTGMCSQGPSSLERWTEMCHPLPAGGKVDCGFIVLPTPLHVIACSQYANAYANITVSVNLCERCEGSTEAGGPCAITAGASPVPGNKNTSRVAFFNTQVVLRGLQVVQSYRKVHPWATDCFDTPTLDVRSFDVSNSAGTSTVKFGLFTCFDIVFPEPSASLLAQGIRHFAYASAIPTIGRAAVELFGKTHNSTMVNANLQTGQTGVSAAGTLLAGCDDSMPCAAIAAI